MPDGARTVALPASPAAPSPATRAQRGGRRRSLTRHLVLTADDLGVDAATNAAIVDLLAEGRVSASTLMAVAPAAGDAADRVLRAGVPHPRLHVTLTGARELDPWRPLAAGVPTLTDAGGAFHTSPARLERAGAPAEVVREMTAQLAWMRRAGLAPAGVDSHSGTLYGMHGRSFAEEAVRFCAQHGLDLRVPRRLSRVLAVALPARFRRSHAEAVALADATGVRLPEAMISCWLPGRLVLSYAQLRASILTQLRLLPAGTSELILHPAPDTGAAPLVAAEARKRRWELRLLRDPVFHRELRREGITIAPAW